MFYLPLFSFNFCQINYNYKVDPFFLRRIEEEYLRGKMNLPPYISLETIKNSLNSDFLLGLEYIY